MLSYALLQYSTSEAICLLAIILKDKKEEKKTALRQLQLLPQEQKKKMKTLSQQQHNELTGLLMKQRKIQEEPYKKQKESFHDICRLSQPTKSNQWGR